MTVILSAVFVMLTCGFELTFAVAVHGGGVLAGVHSVPTAGLAVAVLLITPGGVAPTVAVTLKVTKLAAGNVASVWLIAPVPLAVGQTAPPDAVQVQLWLAIPVGSGSVTGVPFAGITPVFDTTIA